MRKMKIVMVLLLMAVTVAGVYAQGERKRGKTVNIEELAKKKTEKMTKLLDLSDDQAAKIQELNLEWAKEMKLKRESKRAEMKANRDHKKASLEAILTPDQKEKIKGVKGKKKRKMARKMRAKRKEQGANLSAEERARKRTDKMTEKMGLSTRQAEEVYVLNLKWAKEGELKRERMKTQRASNKAEKDAQLKSILSAEQFAKLEAKREVMMGKRGERIKKRKGKRKLRK